VISALLRNHFVVKDIRLWISNAVSKNPKPDSLSDLIF